MAARGFGQTTFFIAGSTFGTGPGYSIEFYEYLKNNKGKTARKVVDLHLRENLLHYVFFSQKVKAAMCEFHFGLFNLKNCKLIFVQLKFKKKVQLLWKQEKTTGHIKI